MTTTFVFATTFAVITYREHKKRRRLFLMLALAFFAFGISDLIEAETGAWWRPFWLLVLKGGCIGVFAYVTWQFRRIRKKADSKDAAADEDSTSAPPSQVS